MRAKQAVRIMHGSIQQSPAFIVRKRRRRSSTQRVLLYVSPRIIFNIFNAVIFHSASFVYAAAPRSPSLGPAAGLINLGDDLVVFADDLLAGGRFVLHAGLAGDPLFVPHGQSPTSCLG